MARVYLDVDPRELWVPSTRLGADPHKLQLQLALFGNSDAGMPPPCVYIGTDGVMMLYNGNTRATRMAMVAPGKLIRVEVLGRLRAVLNLGHPSETLSHDRNAGGNPPTIRTCLRT
jgi:hypothetical protein